MKRPVSRLLYPSVFWYYIIMLLFAGAAAFVGEYYLCAGFVFITVIVFIVSRLRFSRRRRQLMEYVQTATDSVGISVHAGSAFPMAVIRLPENEVIWGNPSFFSITGLNDGIRYQTLDSVIPGFTTNWLREGRNELPGDQIIGDRRYRVYGNYVKSDDDATTVMLATIYFADMTEMFNVRDEFMRTRPVVCICLFDNYDELTNNLSDSAISTLDAQLNECVSRWVSDVHALCRKTERNRYLLVFENRGLLKLQEGKFSILDTIRKITTPTGLAATVSLGIGKDGSDFEENYRFAALAIEMSLSRGGDQAVMKDRYNFTFHGSRTKETERHTHVKSRVVAGSLSELINQSSTIFIMGHKMADLDALGAAVGLLCLCRKRDRTARIVMDLKQNACKDLIGQLLSDDAYRDVFTSEEDALIEADNRSLLIVVDTNRPEQVESRALLDSLSRVAVIDHHRRAADYIEQVVLNLHEPFASSASELVTELLQYSVSQSDLTVTEARCLLAGIVLDTKNFSVRTGARTFEAAAYLRQAGADPVEVKKLFQSDLDATLERYQVVQAARLYRSEIAISCVEMDISRTIASQAADELLNISGITASFVMYEANQQVIICARSIGSCNVQAVLEPLGGGGNGATAGAQIKNKSPREVLQELVKSIEQIYA